MNAKQIEAMDRVAGSMNWNSGRLGCHFHGVAYFGGRNFGVFYRTLDSDGAVRQICFTINSRGKVRDGAWQLV